MAPSLHVYLRFWILIATMFAGGCLAKSGKIDVHHHYRPEFIKDYLKSYNALSIYDTIDWNVTMDQEFMSAFGIQSSILSITAPGIYVEGVDNDTLRSMARRANEYSANLSNVYPGRYGFWATLTLPDIDGSVAEAIYALDTLGADGVILIGSTNGTYVGDQTDTRLFEELNSRSTVVFIHPANSLPGDPDPVGMPGFLADSLLDTVRCINSLHLNHIFRRFPNITWLIAHGGGYYPYGASRYAELLQFYPSLGDTYSEIINRTQQLYFDTTMVGGDWAVSNLAEFARPGHLFFGTDFPYLPLSVIEFFAQQWDDFKFPKEYKRDMKYLAAECLLEKTGHVKKPKKAKLCHEFKEYKAKH